MQAQCTRSASPVHAQCKRSARAVQAQCKRSASERPVAWPGACAPVAERPRPPSLPSRQVLDFSLQQKLRPLMEHLTPLPSIYYPDFIAANQADRATNVLPGQARPPCDARACGACTGTRACRTACCPLRDVRHPPAVCTATPRAARCASARRTRRSTSTRSARISVTSRRSTSSTRCAVAVHAHIAHRPTGVLP